MRGTVPREYARTQEGCLTPRICATCATFLLLGYERPRIPMVAKRSTADNRGWDSPDTKGIR